MSNIFPVHLGLNLLDTIIHPQKIEISGSSNSGCTALSLYLLKKYDQSGLTTMFVDVSRKLNRQYALQNSPEDLAIMSASKTSEIYKIFDDFKDQVDVFVFDDLANISTDEKLKSRHKELLSNMIDYLNREGYRNTLIFINQLRIDPITNRSYAPYGYLLDTNLSIELRVLENRTKYRIIQGQIKINDFGKEDMFSFKLYQDRLEGNLKENEST